MYGQFLNNFQGMFRFVVPQYEESAWQQF